MKWPKVEIEDETYLLKEYLMRPYMCRNPTLQRDHFNNDISTRKYIECAFGVVFAKWLILSEYTETCTENVCTKCFICPQLGTNRGDNMDFDHYRLKVAEANNAAG